MLPYWCPPVSVCSACGAAHSFLFFFFNDTATTEIYTLSLHDALPISGRGPPAREDLQGRRALRCGHRGRRRPRDAHTGERSEEHTSELQSRSDLVCRLLLEKKKNRIKTAIQ